MSGPPVTCPRCGGEGELQAFVSRPGDHGFELIGCSLCGGDGRVDPHVIGWLEVGREHRRARISRLESLLECSKRMGITPSELSAMENGRRDPWPLKGRTS